MKTPPHPHPHLPPHLLPHPKTTISLLLLFLVCIRPGLCQFNVSNLVQNGDFEEYGLNTTKFNFLFLPSNYSCWYNKIGEKMEVQYRVKPYLTAVCELVHDYKYILCQNLTLIPTRLYQINFTVFNPTTMTYSTIILYINGNNGFNHTSVNPFNVTHASHRFYADVNTAHTQICFDSEFNLSRNLWYMGPALDNITVVRLSPDNDFYDIFCTTKIDYSNWQVSIICHYTNTQASYYLNMLKEYIYFYINGQKQDPIDIPDINSTVMKVKIIPNSQFSLQNIAIEIDRNNGATIPVPSFTFYVDGLPVTFTKQKDSQNNLINNMYAVSETILTTTERVYFVLKSCVASYFLINIINFWNLSLMYNVLNITTIPAFSKYFLEKLTFLFFNLNSLSQWAQDSIPILKGKLNFDQTKGREFIDETKNNYAWFGSFGISSNFIQNNVETIFIIFLMILKVLLIFFLRRITVLRKILPRKTRLLKVFLLEVISLQTFMVMSATSNILNFNFTGFKEKLNNFLQIVNILIGLMTITMYFIVSIKVNIFKKWQKWIIFHKAIKKREERRENRLRISKKLVNHRNKARITELNNIFEFIPIMTVPSLILMDKPLIFLVTTGVILLYRFYYFYKNVRKFTSRIDDKIFDAFNIFFWLVLQISYIILWILEKIIANNDLEKTDLASIYSAIKIIGFFIVFTVLIGGLFEILRFIVDVLKNVWKTMKYLLKLYRQYRRIQPLEYQANSESRNAQNQKNQRLVRVENINGKFMIEKVKPIPHSHRAQNELQIPNRPRVKVTIIHAHPHENLRRNKKKPRFDREN